LACNKLGGRHFAGTLPHTLQHHRVDTSEKKEAAPLVISQILPNFVVCITFG